MNELTHVDCYFTKENKIALIGRLVSTEEIGSGMVVNGEFVERNRFSKMVGVAPEDDGTVRYDFKTLAAVRPLS